MFIQENIKIDEEDWNLLKLYLTTYLGENINFIKEVLYDSQRRIVVLWENDDINCYVIHSTYDVDDICDNYTKTIQKILTQYCDGLCEMIDWEQVYQTNRENFETIFDYLSDKYEYFDDGYDQYIMETVL